jgi:hypothetical protein
LNVLLMMMANLVGFAVGVEGLLEMISNIMNSWGNHSY